MGRAGVTRAASPSAPDPSAPAPSAPDLPLSPTQVDRYVARARRLDLDGLDLATAGPLSEPVLRCLRYMHDVESHTVCYLRDLLLTSAHRDPQITAFLTTWAYEEYWHGCAIGELLRTQGEVAGDARVAAMRATLGWRDRVAPLASLLGSAVSGDSFIAVHMAWGAVNEWTTQAGYARLGARAGDATLSELLRRIMRQEGLHIDFYSSEARRRLSDDRRAQRLARFALRRLWRPVGATVMPHSEVRHLATYLFGDEEGRDAARRIDRRIDLLPGLGGLHLVERALASITT
jgi:hypothetical protein